FYWVNSWHVEGPRALAGALDPLGEPVWSRNEWGGAVREDVMDVIGGLALIGDTLVQTADFHFINQSGTYAFDRASGTPRWQAAGFPKGHPSGAGKLVFHAEGERTGGATRLVARSLVDGTVV